MFQDLKSFVHALQTSGDLAVVDAEVDPYLEVAEIHKRVISAQGPALLFRNVKGSGFPLVTNLFGTLSRVEKAFGREPQRFLEDLVALIQKDSMPGLWDILGFAKHIPRVLSIGTKRRRRGPVTEVVRARPELDQVPFVHLAPEDGGSFLTLPLVYTEHPEKGGHNLGMYRIQRYDEATTGIHWQIGKGGGFHYRVAEEAGDALPVVIHLGGPPALILSAIAPLPENVPELLLASLLAKGKIPLVEGAVPGFPLPVVGSAEMALVGWVEPEERRPEGPFGDHYGYYSLQHDFPVFRCQALLHQKDALVPATVVGKPRQEDFYIGDFLQELLSPLFPVVMPQVEDLWSYGETGFHSLAGARIKVRYEREALAAAFRILGEGQLSLTKFLLLTDAPVDLRDFPATLEALLERTDPVQDLRIFDRTSMDTLDYAGGELNKGSKGVWIGLGDPVRKLPAGLPKSLPRGFASPKLFVPGCLVVEGPSYEEDPKAAQVLAAFDPVQDYPLIVLADPGEDIGRSPERFLWATFTRFNPGTDLHPRGRSVSQYHVGPELPIVLDARKKPWYPGEVLSDPDTSQRVEDRWREYFPKGQVVMGEGT